MQVFTVKTNAELKALDLSFYTLCKLADELRAVNPCECLEHRLAHAAVFGKDWKGILTLDDLGNYISFE